MANVQGSREYFSKMSNVNGRTVDDLSTGASDTIYALLNGRMVLRAKSFCT